MTDEFEKSSQKIKQEALARIYSKQEKSKSDWELIKHLERELRGGTWNSKNWRKVRGLEPEWSLARKAKNRKKAKAKEKAKAKKEAKPSGMLKEVKEIENRYVKKRRRK